MGIYRRKDKQKRYYGPWYMQYPKEVDSVTGKVIYACQKVGFSKRRAERASGKKMLEWEKRKHLGLEKKKEYLFRELVDWYLSLPVTMRLKSSGKIKQHCESLKKAFGKMIASRIKPGMVEEYREKKLLQTHYRGTSYRPASVNRELEVMRRIFNLAMRDDRVEKNPCWKVTRLPEKNARDRVLSGGELNTLLQKLPQHAADIVAVGYHTGMRAAEIFNLTCDRVNLKEGFFILECEDTKSGDPRHLYFNGPLREILERLGKVRHISHNQVFPYHAKPLKSIKTPLAYALEETGIRDFRFHDLRHTWTPGRYRAITFSARGYLPSDVSDSPEAYSQDLQVEDLKGLLDALRIDKAHICGLSMGSYTSLLFGLKYPDRACSLTIAGSGYGSGKNRQEFQRRVSELAGRMLKEGMKAVCEGYAQGPTRVQLQNKNPRAWEEFRRQFEEHSAKGPAFTFLGEQRQRPSITDLGDQLQKMTLPVLIILEDEDEPGIEDSLLMKRNIPRAGLEVLPRSGHAVNLEEAERFNRCTLDFITAVDADRWEPRDPRSTGELG